MDFKSKFYIGQEVYTFDYSLIHVQSTCPACEGTGRVSIKDIEYACPSCDGRRKLYDGSKRTYFISGPYKVESISIYARKGEQTNEYCLTDDTTRLEECREDELYATKEEVNEEIKKLDKGT